MNTHLLAQTAVSGLGYLPLVVLGVYLCLLLGLGVYGYIKSKMTEEDYYLAGRRQGYIVTALTIMATFFSSAAMLGVPGALYSEGVVFLAFAINLPIGGAAVYLMGSRIARLGRAKGYVTPADMVADYYAAADSTCPHNSFNAKQEASACGIRRRLWLALKRGLFKLAALYDNPSTVRILVALLGFLYVVPYVIIQMKAGGHLAQQMFPDTSTIMLLGFKVDVFAIGTTVLSCVMLVYILVGGMRSVALADVIQGSLLLTGMLVAGFVAISALGGVSDYFASLAELPPEALSLPGATDRFTAWGMMTLIVFASLASMIQPAQWMRYYAARSTQALKRTALIFSILLPICYLCGVMLVGLGARALYPPTVVTTEVGEKIEGHFEVGQPDQALIAVLRNHGPEVLGPAGAIIVAVIMIAILAASMSTADSNLHALSAVLTRDVYDRFLRPKASQRERAWVGRIVIVAAALFALWLVQVGERNEKFAPLKMIVEMQIVAMAFSCQVLPVTIDMLFVRRGTRAGAVCGMVAGLIVVLLFTPVPGLLLGKGLGEDVASAADYLKRLLDISCWGFVVNTAVFILVSAVTRPPDPKRVAEMARIMQEESG